MTIKEFYEWAVARDYEDYVLVSAGTPRACNINRSDIEIKESPNEELMKGEVWI